MTKPDKETALALFRNLYKVAFADGILAAEEKQVLTEVAWKMGIGPREASDIMSNIVHLDFEIPADENVQMHQLEQIVQMMAVDGNIHPKEYELCLAFARRIGRSKYMLDRILERLKTENA
jgi:uncharacterized tellurite resistance protein B-like protein